MSGSIGGGPAHISFHDIGAGADFGSQSSFANGVASGAVQRAASAASAMQSITLDPISLPTFNFSGIEFGEFVKPAGPDYDGTEINLSEAPVKPLLMQVDLSGLNSVSAPEYNLQQPDVSVPSAPELVTPQSPGAAPSFQPVEMPEYQGGELPAVPTLEELNIPTAPDIDLTQYDVTRPEFSAPEDHLYDNNLIVETEQLGTRYLNTYLQWDTGSEDVRSRWNAMLQGGTGLPAPIEQALFDRAIGREDVSSEQAIKQAQGEWAARGFALPGSTLLARESEIRRANRIEKGRLNRELSIQFHTQEIENLRFTVEQGVRLEAQRFEQQVRTWDAARAVVVASYDVARNLLAARVEVLNAQLQIYQTDVQVLREKIQIELARLEAFRTELEAERVRGEINQQRVQVYTAQLQALQTNVDIYRAEIEGANGLIQAQVAQMDMYRSRVDAYRTEWEGQKVRVDAYNSRVNAEQTKAQLFEAQVRGYASRVEAYRNQVSAEGTKAETVNSYNESLTRQFAAETDAWQSEVTARVEKLRADISAFQAEIQKYGVDVQGEEARARIAATNSELALQIINADVTARLKQVDQQIEQLRLAETLGLESLRNSAQVNSQLAASALSAVNVSASISDSVSRSNTMSGSWSYNESLSGEI